MYQPYTPPTFEHFIWLQPSFFCMGDLQLGQDLELVTSHKQFAAVSVFVSVSCTTNNTTYTVQPHTYEHLSVIYTMVSLLRKSNFLGRTNLHVHVMIITITSDLSSTFTKKMECLFSSVQVNQFIQVMVKHVYSSITGYTGNF